MGWTEGIGVMTGEVTVGATHDEINRATTHVTSKPNAAPDIGLVPATGKGMVLLSSFRFRSSFRMCGDRDPAYSPPVQSNRVLEQPERPSIPE